MGDDNTTDWLDEEDLDYGAWLDQDNRTPNEILKDHINSLVKESKSSETQGAHYKKQIYQIKCWIDDIYAILPTYKEESEWEKERVFDKLKGDEDGK